MDMSEYRGYMPLMLYSEEDGCFIGKIAGLNNHSSSFHGETEEEIRKHFEESVDFYLDTEGKPEKPFAGRITVIMPQELHKKLVLKAFEEGEIFFNNWLVEKLQNLYEHD